MALPSSRDELLIDFASDIAKASNHIMFIDGTTLHLVNRIQETNPIRTFQRPELFNLIVNPAYPIKQVFSEFEYNVPYPTTVTLAQEVKRIVVPNLEYGEVLEFMNLSTVEEENLLFLRNLLQSESTAQSEASILGIVDNIDFGDRIEAIDERAGIKSTITVIKKLFDFENETTVLQGPSELEFVVKQ